MNIIFPLSVVDGMMGGLAFMYEFMHVCKNVCTSLYVYVGLHACMCVRLANRVDNNIKNRIFLFKSDFKNLNQIRIYIRSFHFPLGYYN